MMDPGFIDRHSRLARPVHRLPAAPKAAAAQALILALAVWRDAPAWLTVGAALALAAAALVSRLPWRFLAGRLLAFLPVVLALSALSLATPDGWRQGAASAARSLLCVATAILLAGTTPFSQLLGLLRRLRAPHMLVTTLALAYRYSFVLFDEARRMHVARQARCFDPHKRRDWRWRASLLGRLLLRSTERSERVYSSMLARGWR